MRRFGNSTIRFNPEVADKTWVSHIARVGKIGAWVCNVARRECWWSPELYELFDLPPNLEWLPADREFFLDGTGDQMADALEDATQKGRGYDLEVIYVTDGGERRFARATGEAFSTPEGPCLFGCFQDMTAFHRLRQEALDARMFSDTILDNIPHMIFVKEATDLRFVRFNRAGEQLLGMKSKDLLGKNDYDFFPREQADHFVSKDRQTLASRMTLDIPEEQIDTPGGRRVLHTKKISVRDDYGKPLYLLGISEDVTERKTQQEMIEQQRAALVHSARLSALGEMAGGIAHEINNPLAIIRGVGEQIETLALEPQPDARRLGVLSGRLVTTVDRIAAIVSGLRDFSRDGEGDPFQVMRIKDLVLKTLTLCSEKFKTHGIQIETAGLEPAVLIRCQPVRFSQVLVNLFNNAFDALDGLPESSRKSLILTARDLNADFVELAVRDTGPGIPEDLVQKIMIPFFTTKPIGHGTGLGLSIASGICEAHGGRLGYSRGPEGGACFTITLPAPPREKPG